MNRAIPLGFDQHIFWLAFLGVKKRGVLAKCFLSLSIFYMCFQNIVHLYEISPVFSTCFFLPDQMPQSKDDRPAPSRLDSNPTK